MHLPAADGVSESPLLPDSYDTLWTLVVAVLLVLVVSVVLLLVQAGRRNRGSEATAPGADRLSERLAELDRLRDDGVISPEEHQVARERVLGDL